MTLSIGLDFGTSNSSAAVWNGRNAEIIEMPDGSKSLPSIVSIVDGYILVGEEALEKGRQNRRYMFRHFKRRMGEAYQEASDSGWQTMAGPDGMVAWKGPTNAAGEETIYTTVELASYIIRELLNAAEAKLGERPTVAVVTIPADAGEAQRAATIEAAKLAGLERVELMHEPTAAALAYGFDFAKPRRIAVVDHGGGTLDVSLIQTGKGRNDHALVEVKATDGRRKGLGGMDFDRHLAAYLTRSLIAHNPEADISADPAAMERVMEAAEAAKIRLSGKPDTTVRVADIYTDREGVSQALEEVIDLPTFGAVCADLTDDIAAICKRLVDKAREKDPNFSVLDINDVVLVGGMTRSPIVRQAVRTVFGREPRKDINPEDAVAMGAAIAAARLIGSKTGLTVRQMTTQGYAVKTIHGVAAEIFGPGTSYPVKREVTIANANDDQTALSLTLLEGSDMRAAMCNVLARHRHVLEAPAPAKTKGLKLTCQIDESGRFSVEAADGWRFDGAA